MIDPPLFSIIMPTRNREHLIGRAIQSVLEQHFKDFELVIVDDESSDGTKELIASFNNSRIKYHFQKHEERSTARNKGIELARGRYICFLDDDDYLLPNYLMAFADHLSKNNYPKTILRTGFFREKNGKRIASINYQKDIHQNPVRYIMFNMCGVGSLCIPRPCFEDSSFPDHIYYWEDTYLFLQFLMKYPFIQLDDYQYVYRLHAEMSSIEFYKSPNLYSLVDNNISAMLDFYENFGEAIASFVPTWTRNFLVADKYLSHAIASTDNSKRASLFFLRKSITYPCFRFSLIKKYAIWCVKFIQHSVLPK